MYSAVHIHTSMSVSKVNVTQLLFIKIVAVTVKLPQLLSHAELVVASIVFC